MRYVLFYILCIGSVFSNGYDIVIPVHQKDLVNLDTVLDKVEERIKGYNRIIIVSKERYTDRAEWVNENDYPFTVEDVAKELGGNGGVGKNKRRGWYYQQLLKFYAPAVIEDLSEHYLVFDSDTIPTHEMTFIDEEGKPYLDHIIYGCFIHTYYPHVRKMLPKGAIIDKNKNPIVHHMMFTKTILTDLFESVEERYEVPFWTAFCNCVVDPRQANKQQFYTGASEYMIYFYFCQNFYSDQVHYRGIKLYDRAPSFSAKIPEWADFASHHNYNR